jgi:hypothetical protein
MKPTRDERRESSAPNYPISQTFSRTMKTPIKPTASAAAAEPTPAAPAFDRLASIAIAPRRHEGTARTVCHVTPAGDLAYLYSYSGDFIATVPAAEAEPFLPAKTQTSA